MKTLQTLFKATLTAAVLLAATGLNAESARAGSTQFNPNDLRKAAVAYFQIYSEAQKIAADGATPGMDDGTLASLANTVAEDIGNLNPSDYNDVLAELLSDYRTSPSHRAAVQTLIEQLRDKVSSELENDLKTSTVQIVLHQVFNGFLVAYTFEFGRGYLFTRGLGLSKIEEFGQALKYASTRIRGNVRTQLAAVGIGLGAGVTAAIYEHLRTKKLDPRDQLQAVQRGLVERNAESLVQYRMALQLGFPIPEEDLIAIETDLTQVLQGAPQFKVEISAAAADLKAIRELLIQQEVDAAVRDVNRASLP